jgi:simple sugar transport system substrate-binding protein
VNAGDDAWEELGLLGHIGQTEYEAGFAAGQQLAGDGARKVLCINHEVGNVSLDTRCQGLDDAVGRLRGMTQVLGVDPANAEAAKQAITGALNADPGIDAVLALGPAGATVSAEALESLGKLGTMRFGTFDLEPHILGLVRDGEMLFAIDQQPYMQGYLAVTLMVKYIETRAVPGGGQIIRTGPAFVTQENAADVIRLAEEKLR